MRKTRAVKRQVLKGIKKIEDMTEIEATYLAGIVDGEGCITIQSEHSHPHLTIAMASLIPVKMAVRWGGQLHTHKYKGKKRKYVWELHRRRLLQPILEKIKPYLQQKQKQVIIALEMLEILRLKERDWKDKILVLTTQIKSLNQTGEPSEIDLKTLDGADLDYWKHI